MDLPYIVLATELSVVLTSIVVGIAMDLIAKKHKLKGLNKTLNIAKRADGFGI